MAYRRFLAIGLVIWGLVILALGQQPSITPESLRTWMTYLASDELAGRATFSEGLGLAGAYIADQLKVAGGGASGRHGRKISRACGLPAQRNPIPLCPRYSPRPTQQPP